MQRILCFGDSLTWGIIPGTRQRHTSEWRWPKVLEGRLRVEVLEEALNGRTTAYDFPGRPYRNGMEVLPMLLEQHAPLDTVVIMLGTNDFFSVPEPKAEHILFGIRQLARIVRSPQVEPGMPVPKLVLVTPPLPRVILECPYPFAKVTKDIEFQAARLPELLRDFALEIGCNYYDASHLLTDDADGIHLSQEVSRELGTLLSEADLM